MISFKRLASQERVWGQNFGVALVTHFNAGRALFPTMKRLYPTLFSWDLWGINPFEWYFTQEARLLTYSRPEPRRWISGKLHLSDWRAARNFVLAYEKSCKWSARSLEQFDFASRSPGLSVSVVICQLWKHATCAPIILFWLFPSLHWLKAICIRKWNYTFWSMRVDSPACHRTYCSGWQFWQHSSNSLILFSFGKSWCYYFAHSSSAMKL